MEVHGACHSISEFLPSGRRGRKPRPRHGRHAAQHTGRASHEAPSKQSPVRGMYSPGRPGGPLAERFTRWRRALLRGLRDGAGAGAAAPGDHPPDVLESAALFLGGRPHRGRRRPARARPLRQAAFRLRHRDDGRGRGRGARPRGHRPGGAGGQLAGRHGRAAAQPGRARAGARQRHRQQRHRALCWGE